jgi:hypothetical protein
LSTQICPGSGSTSGNVTTVSGDTTNTSTTSILYPVGTSGNNYIETIDINGQEYTIDLSPIMNNLPWILIIGAVCIAGVALTRRKN